MMTGPYTPTIVHIGSSTNSITTQIRMPEQTTPYDVHEYLAQMGFFPIANSGVSGTVWTRGGNYYTWEQAVVYCLVKPFLNP